MARQNVCEGAADAPHVKLTVMAGITVAALALNLGLGSTLLFLQFTQYRLIGIYGALFTPFVVFIHTISIGAALRFARGRRYALQLAIRILSIVVLPSLVSGMAAILFSIVFAPGIVLAEGCGNLKYEAISPSGSKTASLYSGSGPAGFGRCNYVYVTYRQYPLVRRDVYARDEYVDVDIEEPIVWKNDNVFILTWDETSINLERNKGNIPLWLKMWGR